MNNIFLILVGMSLTKIIQDIIKFFNKEMKIAQQYIEAEDNGYIMMTKEKEQQIIRLLTVMYVGLKTQSTHIIQLECEEDIDENTAMEIEDESGYTYDFLSTASELVEEQNLVISAAVLNDLLHKYSKNKK